MPAPKDSREFDRDFGALKERVEALDQAINGDLGLRHWKHNAFTRIIALRDEQILKLEERIMSVESSIGKDRAVLSGKWWVIGGILMALWQLFLVFVAKTK